MIDTYRYCKTLGNLSKEELIGLVHEAYLQMSAREKEVENLHDKWIIKKLGSAMKQAGHIGFDK